MKTLPIALQLYSVRDELSQDFEKGLCYNSGHDDKIEA